MKKIVFILIWICGIIYANNFGKGLVFDDEEYENTPKSAKLISRDYQILPSKISLVKYAPQVGNQGQTGTCTAWATAYGARTILESVTLDREERRKINKNIFSPSYIYNQIRTQSGCDYGTSIAKALKVMKNQGVAKFNSFGFNCNKIITQKYKNEASNYKIKDYKILFWLRDTNKIQPVKKALSQKKPVLIGMKTPNSFNRVSKLWQPNSRDYHKQNLGGHAMVVVAYDDNRYGGSFLLMNSWGKKWGVDGFTWIKYKDFKHFVKYAYEMIASLSPKKRVEIAGKVEFKTPNGKIMNATYNSIQQIYEMNQPYYSGTKFNFFIKNKNPIYLYAFGFDSTQKTFTIFPHNKKTSPFLGYTNSTIAFPDENHYIKMDNTIGKDFFVILYSTEKLNIQNIKSKIETENGTFQNRLKKALGKQIIPNENINFSKNQIKFKYNSGRSIRRIKKNSLVGIVIKFDHR